MLLDRDKSLIDKPRGCISSRCTLFFLSLTIILAFTLYTLHPTLYTAALLPFPASNLYTVGAKRRPLNCACALFVRSPEWYSGILVSLFTSSLSYWDTFRSSVECSAVVRRVNPRLYTLHLHRSSAALPCL